MILALVFLLAAATSAWSQDFQCGWDGTGRTDDSQRTGRSVLRGVTPPTMSEQAMAQGTKKMLVLFSRYPWSPSTTSPRTEDGRSPSELFNGNPGSFSHYMKEMSFSTLTFEPAPSLVDDALYPSTSASVSGCNYSSFAKEVLDNAASSAMIDYRDYDAVGVVLPDTLVSCSYNAIASWYAVPRDPTKPNKTLDLAVLKQAEFSYMVALLEAGGIHTTWVESQSRSRSDYNMADDCTGWSAAQLTFVKEVIRNAEGSVDFNAQVYDSETPRDMMVDMVMVVLPRKFGHPTDDQICPSGTVFYASSLSDLTVDGVGIEIVITSTYSSSMSFISAVLAHEYGHAMGLPELFDRDKAPVGASDEERHDVESAGIGNWGAMGGATGWQHPDPAKDEVSTGPNPFSVWSRAHVRWIDPVTVTSDLDIAEIEDINASSPSSSRAYRIPISEDGPEYFLVANRQNSHRWRTDTTPGSYYDGFAPSSGLAIWHIDDSVTGLEGTGKEKHKRVDLESADGLYTDKGYDPLDEPTQPNPVSGGDNLDFQSSDNSVGGFNERFDGNRGDDTDLWDGSSYTQFTPHTNPTTDGFEAPLPWEDKDDKENQNFYTGIFIEGIGQVTGKPGVMKFKVRFAPMAPNSLDAAAGENQVGLTWEAPNDNPATIASYKVRHRLSSSDSESDWTTNNASSTTSHTVTGLTNDSEYTFEVFAVASNDKEGQPASITSTPQQTIAGDASPEFDEIPDNTQNWESLVGRYEKSGSYDWSLAGADSLMFQLEGSSAGFRNLHFLNPPNFEAPGSADGDNSYEITVKVEEAGASGASGNTGETRFMKPVTVEVTNENETGRVTVTPDRYQVDVELTATLTDPDSPRQP